MAGIVMSLIIITECTQEGENRGRCKKRKWSKEWLQKKATFSNEKLLKKLEATEEFDYFNYMRMSQETFRELLTKVTPLIRKKDTFMRDAIAAETRLAITLRFLATGNSFEDLKFSFAVSPQSIGEIVVETCEAINYMLKQYIQLPRTADAWKIEADKFYRRSGFPHCIGAIDGKHVQIKKPANFGSFYFNYKKTFSVVLMALVNADSEFLMVDVGTNGRISDGGVFSNSKFFDKFEKKQLGLPIPSPLLPGMQPLPYVIVGDDAFALRPDLMKPYAHDNLTNDEIFFNRTLSSARVKVENAFGILASRFRLLLTTINLSPEKATTIVLTCCYLHNYLRRQQVSSRENHIQPSTHEQDTFFNMQLCSSRNSSHLAKSVRESFRETLKSINETNNN